LPLKFRKFTRDTSSNLLTISYLAGEELKKIYRL